MAQDVKVSNAPEPVTGGVAQPADVNRANGAAKKFALAIGFARPEDDATVVVVKNA